MSPIHVHTIYSSTQLTVSRYLLGTTLGLLILYNAFKRTVLAPLDKAAEDIEQSLDEDTKKEVGMTEDDNDSFFLPFPGTIKQVQERPFRGSDPEWQEYVKFSKDAKLGKRVRGTGDPVYGYRPHILISI